MQHLTLTHPDGRVFTDDQHYLAVLWNECHIVKGDDETPDWLPEEYEADHFAIQFSDGTCALCAWGGEDGLPLEPMSLTEFTVALSDSIPKTTVEKAFQEMEQAERSLYKHIISEERIKKMVETNDFSNSTEAGFVNMFIYDALIRMKRRTIASRLNIQLKENKVQ